MLPEIKLTISQKDILVQTVCKKTENQHLAKSLEEFQVEVNAALTKMIEDLGDIGGASGDCNMDEEDEEENDDNEGSLSQSDKHNGQTKCKRKKCG